MALGAAEIQEKIPNEERIKKLVRIDLLKTEAKEMKPPLRNIFSGDKIENAGLLKQNGVLGSKRPEGSTDIKAYENAGQQGDRSPQGISSFNLRYLGYIASLEKKVALVLYNGEVMAVEKGSVLSGGIRVHEITLNRIEVIIPGSDKLVIKLEGEEQ